jgi:hypothetical protein
MAKTLPPVTRLLRALALAALAACFTSDVRALCCPSACAVARSSRWYEADRTLTACARSLRCYHGSSTLDTRMVCQCLK